MYSIEYGKFFKDQVVGKRLVDLLRGQEYLDSFSLHCLICPYIKIFGTVCKEDQGLRSFKIDSWEPVTDGNSIEVLNWGVYLEAMYAGSFFLHKTRCSLSCSHAKEYTPVSLKYFRGFRRP